MMYSRINLLWNYNYSSDVVHGMVLHKDIPSSVENCNIKYSNVKVLESFKGKMQSEQIFKVVGVGIHESDNVGSEQFLLLKPFVATSYPGFGDCKNEDWKDYLVVHNWCCSLEGKRLKLFVTYNMINSEEKGGNYLRTTELTFIYLRYLKFVSTIFWREANF